MKLSRTDLVAPLLAIIAGGAIGGLLTLSPLVLWSPADDVPVAVPVVAPSDVPAPEPVVTPAVTPGLEVPKRIEVDGMMGLTGARIEVHILTGGRIEVDGTVLTGDRIEFEKLPEGGWDVTSQPPVFWLPEIRQR